MMKKFTGISEASTTCDSPFSDVTPDTPEESTILDEPGMVFVGNLTWSVKWQDLKDHMKQVGNVDYVKVLTHDGAERGRSRGFAYVRFSTEAEAQQAIMTLNQSELSGRQIIVSPWTGTNPKKGLGKGFLAAKDDLMAAKEDHLEAKEDDGTSIVASVLAAATSEDNVLTAKEEEGTGSPKQRWADLIEDGNVLAQDDCDWSMPFMQPPTIYMKMPKGWGKGWGKGVGKNGGGKSIEVHGDLRQMVHVSNLPFKAEWQTVKDHMKKAGTVEFVKILNPYGTEFGHSRGIACVRFASEEQAQHAIATLNDTTVLGRQISVIKWTRGYRPGKGVEPNSTNGLALEERAGPALEQRAGTCGDIAQLPIAA